MTFLSLIVSLWAIICGICMVGTAFGMGWVLGRRPVDRLATLRPAIEGPAGPSSVIPNASAIWTTRCGKYWHSDTRCTWLETSTQVLFRLACPHCAKVHLPQGPVVAETPPGEK